LLEAAGLVTREGTFDNSAEDFLRINRGGTGAQADFRSDWRMERALSFKFALLRGRRAKRQGNEETTAIKSVRLKTK
jgi:hypothetical protein